MKKKVIAVALSLIMAVGLAVTLHNTSKVAVNTGIKFADGTIPNSIDPPDW